LNFKRYGGDHNLPGNDGGCFAAALATVRRVGGVLEHPASSRAWAAHGLPRPLGIGWQNAAEGEWTTEVWQSAYGHRARKRTWLFACSIAKPVAPSWLQLPGEAQCGWFDRIKPTLGKREASATPIAFAQFLIEIASQSR